MKIMNILLATVLSATGIKASAQDFKEMTYTPQATTFKLFAPSTAKSVVVRIYNDGEGGKPVKKVKMKLTAKDTWQAVVKGNLMHLFYTFDISGDNRHPKETPGIFAKAVGINGRRAAIINMAGTNPSGWAFDKKPQLKSPADLIIYELHLRDFSVDKSSGIKRTGKFLSLIEPEAIAHLKTLGVNAVHLQPSFDFASVDEANENAQYNWGYDPLNYNVPEGSYSTYPYNPAVRIKEFKEMVQELHRNGIRVIMDVVYNHTYNIEGSSFQLTYPDYFFRKNDKGEYSNGSGCGNETASEQPMMRKFIIESMKYWATEYHVDGFRVDLMGVHDIETMNMANEALKAIDPTIFIYGEGWSAGTCALPATQLAMKANMKQLPGIAAFGDELRDALRGPISSDAEGAFLIGKEGDEESIKFGIAGAISHPQIDYSKVNYSKSPWADEPTQMIAYVSCHDDMCLVDRLKTELPNISDDELIRLDLLAQTAVFTSQGIPFMLAGEEMLRTKQGVHNSFNSPDRINRIDWSNKQKYPKAFTYYCRLINMRKNHPAFRLGSAELVRKHLEFLPTKPCLVGFILKDNAGGDKWKDITVVLNSSKEAQTINIPEGEYTIVACDGEISEDGLGTMQGGEITVNPQSALILHR